MIQRLEEVAIVNTGIYAQPYPNGDIVYLQVKYFSEDGQIVQELHQELKKEEINEKHLLKNGDVLFASKGSKNFATVYSDRYGISVASTAFMVIKLKPGAQILPDYLAWFLNHPDNLNSLKDKATGTGMPSITKNALQEIELYIPSIEKQRLILKIYETGKRKDELLKKLTQLNQLNLQRTLINAVKNGK